MGKRKQRHAGIALITSPCQELAACEAILDDSGRRFKGTLCPLGPRNATSSPVNHIKASSTGRIAVSLSRCAFDVFDVL